MDISEFIISVLKFTIDGASAAAAKSLQSCQTQRPHGLQPTRLLCPWDFSGKSTGVGCHCLLWDHLLLCQICLCLHSLLHLTVYNSLTNGKSDIILPFLLDTSWADNYQC